MEKAGYAYVGRKIVASRRREEVDAESIINNVLGNYMSFGESYGVISGKTKNEVIEMLWRGLNTAEPGRQAKVALDIAEYILQNAVLENI